MSLISTYDLRLWMGIEEGDTKPNAKLEGIAGAIEDFCDSFTNRKLEAKRYLTDPQFSYLDGSGCRYIYVPQYPISYLSSANVDSERTFGSATLIDSSDFFFYPSGKIESEAGYFTLGRRNVLLDYTAGYAPVVGGTHDSSVSTYPIPLDLKQTMIEMTVNSFKEGITAVHSVQNNVTGQESLAQMLTSNSFWRNTLTKYKAFDQQFQYRDE